jgi:hypothetical protein
MRTCKPSFIPTLESLDDRITPTIDVHAEIGGDGKLYVFGDGAGNDISIRQDNNGAVTILGFNGTLVNGQSAFSFGVGTLAGMDVRLNDGNDRLEVAGVHTTGTINILTLYGNDFMVFYGTVSQSNFFIDAGGDDDIVALNVITGAVVDVNGNSGFDRLDNDGVSGTAVSIHDFEANL